MFINLQVPDEVVARVDEVRGDVNRTRWIVRAIEARLGTPVRVPEPAPSQPLPPRPRTHVHDEPEEKPVIHKFEAKSKYDSSCKHCGQRERTH